jgi:hypothetical protein
MGFRRPSSSMGSVFALVSNFALMSTAVDLANGYVDDIYTHTDEGSMVIVQRTFVVTDIWKPRYIKSSQCEGYVQQTWSLYN